MNRNEISHSVIVSGNFTMKDGEKRESNRQTIHLLTVLNVH